MMDYKGNQFELEEERGYWRGRTLGYNITNMEIHSDEVWLPDSFRGTRVSQWNMRKESGVFLEVRVLHIPKTISRINIRNDVFPNLEKVEIDSDNESYFTDGRFIMTYDNMSRRKKCKCIVYCPVCKGEQLWISDDIRKICNYSFAGTQYRTIHFPKTETDIEPKAFDGSAWLDGQQYPVVIGDLLYKIKEDETCLLVPEGVRRFALEVFDGCYIQRMSSPILPVSAVITRLNDKGSLKSLEITSNRADINVRLLRRLETLEEVVIAEGHPRYRTSDGVVFSADGRSLVYYPSFKRNGSYRIPDGVSRIEESAFANQKYLEELVMPNGVTIIGPRAFIDCRALKSVRISPNVRELPDSSTYHKGGVFEGCVSLQEIALPEKMTYLGSYAFYKSGLKRIALNRNLQQMGEYALMANNLREVQIPESVQRLGKGCLFYATRVEAYEGTARGLVSALNAVSPEEKDSRANLNWKRCDVTVLHEESDARERFMIPDSLARSAAYHLDMAWNNDRIDYAEYDECLGDIDNADEKLEFAADGIARCETGETNAYTEYVRRVSYKIAANLLERKREEDFLQFLKQDYLSAASLEKLAKLSNKMGMTVCTAYILEKQHEQ